jgi:hypothetical protein
MARKTLCRALLVGFVCVTAAMQTDGRFAAKEQDSEQKAVANVFAGSFEGVTPGKTTSTELPTLLGSPERRIDGGKQLVFRVASFEDVRTTMKAGVVQQVQVTLRVGSPTAWAKGFLGVEELKHVDVERGDEHLRLIPERGIYMVRKSATSDDITHIRIQEPSSADFLARAENQRRHGYSQTWSDLDTALAMSPDRNSIRISLAELALHLERYIAAEKHLSDIPEAERDGYWRLLSSRWVIAIGARKDAVAAVEHVMDPSQSAPAVHMAGLVERAKIELQANDGDMRQASQWLEKATAEAMQTLANDRQNMNAAKVLFDAHLLMMRVIASGEWDRQEATLERWQNNAEQLVPHVMLDGANIGAKQDLAAAIIGSQTSALNSVDWGPLVQKLETATIAMVQKGDPLLAQHARRTAAAALTKVAMRQLQDGDPDAATSTFEAALAALTNGAKSGELETANLHQLADVLFARGVVDSVGIGNHEAASVWFRRMLSAMDDPRAKPYPSEAIIRGDQLVSIGVSFWQIDAKQNAIEVTERGLQLIDSAIDVGWATAGDRMVAVENLKAMHASLGNAEKAEFYGAQLTDKVTR